MVAALLAVGLAGSIKANFLKTLVFGRRDLETITVTEVSPGQSLARAPSPANPVYYAAISGGFRDFSVAYAGEKHIDRHFVDATVTKALAKQGYLRADAAHPASIVLVWTWGTMNAEFWYNGERWIQLNRGELVNFLGGKKLGMDSWSSPFPEQVLTYGLTYQSVNAQNLTDAASDHLYVIVVTAYSASRKEGGKPVRLWNTRISCPARGFWLPEVLPAMVAMGAPQIGRETAAPVWVVASDKFKAEVELGDVKVLDDLPSATPERN